MAQGEGGGRPTKFKDEYIELGRKLAKLGHTDQEMAEVFEVSVRVLYDWKREYPKFLQATKIGKKQADDRVVRSLFQRATGYSHPELVVFNYKGQIITHEVLKQYPPDTTAAIFWLKNRRPADWRDKKEVELTNPKAAKDALDQLEDDYEQVGSEAARQVVAPDSPVQDQE